MPRYGTPPAGEWAQYIGKGRWVIVSKPRILRGDEMHYLIMANSLGRDGDLRLSYDYANVLRGGLDMGFWHRGYRVRDPYLHFTRKNDMQHGQFSLIGKHPMGLSAVLAVLLWPLAGTAWMEAACIWVTVIVAVAALHFLLLILRLRLPWSIARNTTLLVAFGTPMWHYARTLYTEVYMALGYLVLIYAMLRGNAGRSIPLLGILAWFKYPALLMFFSGGIGEWLQKRRRNFCLFGIIGALVFVAITAFNRWFYHRAGYMVFGGAVPRMRGGISAPIAFIPGEVASNMLRIMFDGDKGLLSYTPVLMPAVAGLVAMWKRERELLRLVLCCALPWFVLHVCYRYMMSGDSYSTRYLVPIVPMLMIGVPWFRERFTSRGARVFLVSTVVWSIACNTLAGVFPGITFSQTPLQMFGAFGRIVKALL